jgi:hypothetical protein
MALKIIVGGVPYLYASLIVLIGVMHKDIVQATAADIESLNTLFKLFTRILSHPQSVPLLAQWATLAVIKFGADKSLLRWTDVRMDVQVNVDSPVSWCYEPRLCGHIVACNEGDNINNVLTFRWPPK